MNTLIIQLGTENLLGPTKFYQVINWWPQPMVA